MERRDQLSDAALLAAVATGDGAAFAEIYRRHLATVIAFLVRQTGDLELAADLAAEVFSAAMISAGRYTAQGSSAAPWLLGIARNKLLKSLRRGRVEQRARERLRIEAMELDDGDLDEVERLADAGESRLSELLAELPENEQHAIQARVVREQSYSEVAAQLDCSELVVRQRVSRGLSRLRRGLEEGQ